MATYIVEGRYSGEAIRGFVASPEDREMVVAQVVEAAGGKLRGFYVTSGENDFLVIVEAPDMESVAAAGLTAAAGGGVTHAATRHAWTGKEFMKICEKAKAAAGAYKMPGK